jgi:two-component system, NarL family, sensor histidine kinase DesK
VRSAAGEATRPVPPVAWSEVGADAGYRRARLVTLTALAVMFVSSAAMPAIGLGVEQRLPWRILGAAGIALFTAGRGWALWSSDVHDLLGHDLSVIALKAEPAERLAPVDPERTGEQAAEIQRLAASALVRVRQAVHGYRAVDLRDQLSAVEHVLRSAGVHCVVRLPGPDLPGEASHLVPVLREATTNVLRHSRAQHCTIDVAATPGEVRMVVTNDGVAERAPDPYSHGLRGLSDRLAEVGGTVSD